MSDDLILDLDAARKQRAAEREGKKQDMPIRLGGEQIATLPVELPVDVLAPLRSLDGDLTLLLREAMNSAKAGPDASKFEATELVVDILASNPRLPMTALDTFAQVARNLLGDAGFEALVAQRPTAQDYAFLVKGVFRFYGLTLGEASPSSDSSTDAPRTDANAGETSSGTSSITSTSTPEPSGTTPEPTTSSESVAS